MLKRLLSRIRLTDWRGNVDGRVTFWSRRLVSWRGRCAFLHCIVAPDDDGCFHSHPATAIRIVIAGGYVEEFTDGRRRIWRPGMVGIVRPTDVHRIAALIDGHSFSLWLRGPKAASIRLVGPGWPEHLRSPEAS